VRRTEPDEQITRAPLERVAPTRPRRSSCSRVIASQVAYALLALGPNGIRLRTADYTADNGSCGGGVRFMSASSPPSDPPPFTQNREFWLLMGYAVALGVFGAFAGLVFMGVIGFGGRWYADADPGWFGGQWWWVAVTAGAGVVVGLLRRLTRLPEQIPGLIHDLQEGHVDPRMVPGVAVVSAVSLIGGASLGPEKALGSMDGGGGTWIGQRRNLSREDSQVCTLSGFGCAPTVGCPPARSSW